MVDERLNAARSGVHMVVSVQWVQGLSRQGMDVKPPERLPLIPNVNGLSAGVHTSISLSQDLASQRRRRHMSLRSTPVSKTLLDLW